MTGYLSVVYDEGSHPYTNYPLKLCAYLFQVFQMKPGMKMLEPGCGRGEFLRNFKNLGLECTGLDCSAETSTLLAESGIPLEVCDVEKVGGLPFPDNSFDMVYNKSFLEHLREPDRFLREARRVLKPGGLLLSLVPDWEVNYKIYFDDFTHRTPFTVISLRDIYLMCDFERISVYKFRQLPIVWRFPLLNYFCAAISPFVPVRTKNKFLRWSRELMLIGSAYKGDK
jgi:ubiquinone/menaquinone biosynthesis C-methylase UbiE